MNAINSSGLESQNALNASNASENNQGQGHRHEAYCRYCQSTSPTIRMVNCVLGFIEYYNDSAINEIMKKNVQ